MTNFITKIMSGGQTGVDRAALDIAIKLEMPHGGWCPKGRMAEDGHIPEEYNLQEAPTPIVDDDEGIYKIRTELNVRDSEGTLVIVKDDPMGGTLYTIEMAKKYIKPCFIFNVLNNSSIEDIASWIIKNNIHTLNIAGPRASQTEDIYNLTYKILKQLLNQPLLTMHHPNLNEKNIPRKKL